MTKPPIEQARECLEALKAIADGYKYSIQEEFVVVENPKYQPDNGENPSIVFEVANLTTMQQAPGVGNKDAALRAALDYLLNKHNLGKGPRAEKRLEVIGIINGALENPSPEKCEAPQKFDHADDALFLSGNEQGAGVEEAVRVTQEWLDSGMNETYEPDPTHIKTLVTAATKARVEE